MSNKKVQSPILAITIRSYGVIHKGRHKKWGNGEGLQKAKADRGL